MNLKSIINQFRIVLQEKLARKKESDETAKVIVILVVGILCRLVNPNQIANQLEIEPKQLYKRLRKLSARDWRRLLEQIMLERGLEELRKFEQLSPASKSRLKASIVFDSTVQKRLGKMLSYVWIWYSGQLKKLTRGQELLAICLVIGKTVIPLSLIFVSKQGRGSTTKPSIIVKEMKRLKLKFEAQSIDLTQLGISFDSWFVSNELSEQLANLGFTKQVFAGKSNLKLTANYVKQTLSQHYPSLILSKGWAQDIEANRVRGTSPSFGLIAVVFFKKQKTKVFSLLVPSDPLRSCETLRIWQSHHWVEVFFKRLKSWLGLGKMQLQHRSGAWAEITLRVLAYLLAQDCFYSDISTIDQLAHFLLRIDTFSRLIQDFLDIDFQFLT